MVTSIPYPRVTAYTEVTAVSITSYITSKRQKVVKTVINKTGTATDSYPPGFTTFQGYEADEITVHIWNAAAEIQLLYLDTGIESDTIELAIGIQNIPATCKGFRIRNATAGSDARYQVSAWITSIHANATPSF